jgi:hypothetical protein
VAVYGPTVDAAIPRPYNNCTALNKKYPHGVGRVGARDKVKPGNEPVTTFKRSNWLYNTAMRCNRGLDRRKKARGLTMSGRSHPARDRPIDHHIAGRQAVYPDKFGRSRADWRHA